MFSRFIFLLFISLLTFCRPDLSALDKKDAGFLDLGEGQ